MRMNSRKINDWTRREEKGDRKRCGMKMVAKGEEDE